MENSPNDLGNEVTTEKLMQDLRTLVQDGTELLKHGAEGLSEKGKQVRAKLSAGLESARATLTRLEEKGMECSRTTDRVIREHPYQSIGIAFGVGLLIGVLVNRR